MVRAVSKSRTADATKITDVIEACTRDRRDVIRESEMRIKDETKVTSRDSRRDRVAITENKFRIIYCSEEMTDLLQRHAKYAAVCLTVHRSFRGYVKLINCITRPMSD